MKLIQQKEWRLLRGENCIILTSTVFDLCHGQMDGHTDRQTDGHTEER